MSKYENKRFYNRETKEYESVDSVEIKEEYPSFKILLINRKYLVHEKYFNSMQSKKFIPNGGHIEWTWNIKDCKV